MKTVEEAVYSGAIPFFKQRGQEEIQLALTHCTDTPRFLLIFWPLYNILLGVAAQSKSKCWLAANSPGRFLYSTLLAFTPLTHSSAKLIFWLQPTYVFHYSSLSLSLSAFLSRTPYVYLPCGSTQTERERERLHPMPYLYVSWCYQHPYSSTSSSIEWTRSGTCFLRQYSLLFWG